ncbi:MAG: DEAD/DEAH box helicase [Spirochaetaceae bacterium]|jgi:superfamily II DNA/RNA helicase|nr:DEAD/DEAH box helicase [Spirochaetaceae bacterium]
MQQDNPNDCVDNDSFTKTGEINFAEGLAPYFTKKLSQAAITKATAIQTLVIPRLLNNENIVFRSQTGTGKTYCYLLPVLQHLSQTETKTAIIIAPTLELCAQIKKEADSILSSQDFENEIKTVLLTGNGNIKHQQESLKRDKPRLLIGNTKRILQLASQKKIHLQDAAYIVLDEVDKLISPELLDETQLLVSLLKKDIAYTACSATISAKTKEKIQKLFNTSFSVIENDDQEILQNYITHIAIWSEPRRKIDTLRSFLAAVKPKKTLVFTDKGDEVQNIVSKLQFKKISASGLYSGIEKKERKLVMDNFCDNKIDVLVSSDLAARGLDFQDITYVIEMTVPQDSEIYIHRAGRTARAGKKGTMVSIGTDVEMHRLLAIEKKMHLTVYPKILYKGSLCKPEDIE